MRRRLACTMLVLVSLCGCGGGDAPQSEAPAEGGAPAAKSGGSIDINPISVPLTGTRNNIEMMNRTRDDMRAIGQSRTDAVNQALDKNVGKR